MEKIKLPNRTLEFLKMTEDVEILSAKYDTSCAGHVRIRLKDSLGKIDSVSILWLLPIKVMGIKKLQSEITRR